MNNNAAMGNAMVRRSVRSRAPVARIQVGSPKSVAHRTVTRARAPRKSSMNRKSRNSRNRSPYRMNTLEHMMEMVRLNERVRSPAKIPTEKYRTAMEKQELNREKQELNREKHAKEEAMRKKKSLIAKLKKAQKKAEAAERALEAAYAKAAKIAKQKEERAARVAKRGGPVDNDEKMEDVVHHAKEELKEANNEVADLEALLAGMGFGGGMRKRTHKKSRHN